MRWDDLAPNFIDVLFIATFVGFFLSLYIDEKLKQKEERRRKQNRRNRNYKNY